MNELTNIENSEIASFNDAPQLPSNPWVGMIEKALSKDVNMETIEKFITLQRQEEDRQAERAFNAAMSKFQGLMPEISKTGFADYKNGTTYNFDKINDICNAIRPVLIECGLSYGFKMRQEGELISVQCTVKHSLGHQEFNAVTASPDKSGAKNQIQQISSTNTYLQKLTLKAAFGISSADDDGQASSKIVSDKANKETYESWKLTFDAVLESKSDIESLTNYKNESVNYAAKYDREFTLEIYNKFEETKKAKGW